MNRQPVESKLISSIGYDPDKEELEIQFRLKGTVYRYSNVGAIAWKDFNEAKSKGKHFLQFIKTANYPYERIEEPSEDQAKDPLTSGEAPTPEDYQGERAEE